MGRLIEADALLDRIPNPYERREVSRWVDEAPTVDAMPIDWINLFNCTPIGGDSIDDMLLEWRYQQEVKAERERDENGDHHD